MCAVVWSACGRLLPAHQQTFEPARLEAAGGPQVHVEQDQVRLQHPGAAVASERVEVKADAMAGATQRGKQHLEFLDAVVDDHDVRRLGRLEPVGHEDAARCAYRMVQALIVCFMCPS